jgi:two-component system, chemotaxis family, CheB/CheR fusion protein
MSDTTDSNCRPDNCRVLVVEDNPNVARMATMMLELYGLDVRTLSHGRIVVETALTFRPHFILLDIGLPDIDGFQVARLLRQDAELKDSVIVAVSGHSPDMYPGESSMETFDHYLVKPVDFDSLVPLLRSSSGHCD